MRKHLHGFLRYAFLAFSVFVLTSTAAAQQSGVLVAVSGQKAYQTYWIVHTPGEAHIASTLSDVIVPHGSGFWRVGIVQVCEFDGNSNGHREIVYQTPLAIAPTVYQRTACVRRRNVQDRGIEEAGISYVSPLIVSENYMQAVAEECDPRGGHDHSLPRVHRLGETEPISASQVAPSVSQEQFRKTLQQAYEELGLNCPEPPDESDMDLKNFFVLHEKGAWHPFAQLVGWEYQGECQVSGPIPEILPPSVTSEKSSEDLFATVSKSSPNLIDLFVAPGGTWAIAATKQTKTSSTWTISISAFELNERGLGTNLLNLKLMEEREIPSNWDMSNVRTPIVETQWAMGKHVADWTATLTAAQRAGLPQSKVIVDSKRAKSPFDVTLNPNPNF